MSSTSKFEEKWMNIGQIQQNVSKMFKKTPEWIKSDQKFGQKYAENDE